MKRCRIIDLELRRPHAGCARGCGSLLAAHANIDVVGFRQRPRGGARSAATETGGGSHGHLDARSERHRRDLGSSSIVTGSQGDHPVHARQRSSTTTRVRAGARGYLLKESATEEIAEAVRTVHVGGNSFSRKIHRQLQPRTAAESRSTACRGASAKILQLVAKATAARRSEL